MTTTEANSTIAETHTCPLCGTALQAGKLDECTRCDWTAHSDHLADHTRDVIAVFLSVVPGLGHIYKGHYLTGALYMIGSVFAAFAIAVAATFTAGWGVLLMPLYWAGVMLQVYFLEDRVVATKARA